MTLRKLLLTLLFALFVTASHADELGVGSSAKSATPPASEDELAVGDQQSAEEENCDLLRYFLNLFGL